MEPVVSYSICSTIAGESVKRSFAFAFPLKQTRLFKCKAVPDYGVLNQISRP